jgi:hypothetical protein
MIKESQIAWPETRPNLPVDLGPPWWIESHNRMLESIKLELPKPRAILEIGSAWGHSITKMAKVFPDSFLICIDMWDTSPFFELEAARSLGLSNEELQIVKDGRLFEQFLANVWDLKERLMVVKGKSGVGIPHIGTLHKYARIPDVDLVYVDGSHEEPDVIVDCALSLYHFPNAVIFGDDYQMPGVRDALDVIYGLTGKAGKSTNGRVWRF